MTAVATIEDARLTRGILCVVDRAQAVGNIAVDVKAFGCDAYAASGHKWLRGGCGEHSAQGGRDQRGSVFACLSRRLSMSSPTP